MDTIVAFWSDLQGLLQNGWDLDTALTKAVEAILGLEMEHEEKDSL